MIRSIVLLDDGTFIRGIMEWFYKDFIDAVKEASSVLKKGEMFPQEEYGKYFSSGEQAIKGMALAIISVCFLIDLIQNVLLKADELRMEDVIKALIKLVIAKSIIDFTPSLLAAMRSSAGNVIDKLTEGGSIGFDYERCLPTENDYDWAVDLFVDIGFFAAHIFQFIILFIAGLAIEVIAYARNFELKIFEIASPIPMSFLPWSETKDIPKRFLLNYFAICLQGVVLLIATSIFVTLINSIGTDTREVFFKLSVYSVVYLMAIFKSGQISKQLLGVA